MVQHLVEFDYKLPEGSSMTIDMDEALDIAEKEAIAMAEIKESYDDVLDITITSMRVI